MILIDCNHLRHIATVEYADIVVDAFVPGLNELRIFLRDSSFVDVWFSLKLTDRYSYHWERQTIDGTLDRHDNAPHQRWGSVATFPHHFHDGSESNVVASYLSQAPDEALQHFLTFVRDKLRRLQFDAGDSGALHRVQGWLSCC